MTVTETPPPETPRKRLRWGATLALGAAGGGAASLAGLPLPWLLGALIAVGGWSAAGLRVAGGPPVFPNTPREVCIPVVGVLIGGAFAPETVAGALSWWPGLVAVAAFVPAALFANYLLLTRIGGLSPPTAYFAAMPGGLIEAIELGVEAGADPRPLTVLQFTRIALTVTAVPLVFSAIEGRAVGSAGGARFAAAAPLGLADALILVGCGLIGHRLATRWRIPAGRIIGPITLSAAAHAAGLTEAQPPQALVSLAQLVIGTTLGLRFVGLSQAELRRYLGLSALTVGAMLAIGAVFAAAATAFGAAPFAVMVLSLAPGGVVEMGLIALSLNASPILVTAHHLVRILAAVGIGVGLWKVIRPGDAGALQDGRADR